MARADLTVRGGGITGLAIAWQAIRRGAKVRVIETDCLGAGASGGLVGALAPHTPEQWTETKAFQLAALIAAPTFWSEVEAASSLATGYARTHRWQPIADDAALARAEARAEAAHSLWQGLADWRVIPHPDHPMAPPSPTGRLIEDTLSARIHPRMALAALAAAIRAHRGEIIEGRDAPEEGATIHATGPAGLATLSDALGRPIGKGVKGQAALFRCPGYETAPQVYAEGLHIVPHSDGTIALGSTSETDFDDPTGTDDQLETLISRARGLLPLLEHCPVIERWAGLRPRARSRQPLMGPWPGRPGHFVANGGFKIGFGLAPEVARRIVALALEGADEIPGSFRL